MFGQRKLLVTSLLVPLALNHATAAAIGFKPAVNYPVGKNPVAVAAGDFDGDGKIDLAVVNSGDASVADDGGVSILLGNGDGTFRAAVNIPAGKNPVSIAVADFNGDNRPDLAIVNFDGGVGNVGILISNGNGTFQSPVDYTVASGASMVAIGDFNSDLKPDVVVSGSSVSVLLGSGDGTFRPHVELAFGGQDIVVADFNGDGKADLATRTGFVRIALGNGDGTFQAATFAASLSAGITLGDFNGDGKIDMFLNHFNLFAPPNSPKWIGVFSAGNGDGTFQSGASTGLDLTSSGGVFHDDFNGDGKLDLMKPDNYQSILLYAGNGNGTFQKPISLNAGSSPNYAASIDLNGDKSPDIIATNSGDNTISILLNSVGTDFSIAASTASPSTLRPGQSATSTLTLSLLNAFDNPVTFACSVQPMQAGSPTCSLDPKSVTFDAARKASAQLTIAAGTAVVALKPSSQGSPLWQFAWLPVVGFAVLGTGLGRDNSKKRRMKALIAACLFPGLIAQSACGSSGGSKPQTYTVMVMATSGMTQHSATVTITAQ